MTIARAILVAVLAFAPAAPAAAVTFGSDLTVAADAGFDCTVSPFDFAGAPRPPSGAQTCTYTQTPEAAPPDGGGWPAAGIAAGPLAVPGHGRLTAMRVRAGATTGPMRLVVLRTSVLRAVVNGTVRVTRVCCRLQAATPVFTPTPDAVTTVPVSFRVRRDTREPAQGGEVLSIDAIGVSVMAPGIPVPLHDTAVRNTGGGPPVAMFPAPPEGSDSGGLAIGTDRYEVLVNADFTPEAEILPPRVLGARRLAARVAVRLRCASPERCRGRLTLDSRRAGAPGPFARYASGPYSVGAGRTADVLMAPAVLPPGRAVWVNLTAADGVRASARVTIRR